MKRGAASGSPAPRTYALRDSQHLTVVDGLMRLRLRLGLRSVAGDGWRWLAIGERGHIGGSRRVEQLGRASVLVTWEPCPAAPYRAARGVSLPHTSG